MKLQKSHIITAVLLVMTVFLIGAIILIGVELSNEKVEQASIAPKKTKAQATNYNKLIAVNQKTGAQDVTSSVQATPTLTTTPIPTSGTNLTPTEKVLVQTNPTGSLSPNLTITGSASPSVSLTQGVNSSLSGTIVPTKAKTLPKTGIITNSIIMFGAAGLLVFFSFIL